MTLTLRRSADLRATPARLVCALALFAACAHTAAAQAAAASVQEAATPEAQAAVIRLLEAEKASERGYAAVARTMDRFREVTGDMLIADIRAGGGFKGLSPAEGAELERRVRVFMADVYTEYKSEMFRRITTESMARVIGPVLIKNFTVEEMNEATAFDQTTLGKKVIGMLPEIVAESSVAAMAARGFFDAARSQAEGAAKLRRLYEELLADPDGYVHQIYERVRVELEKRLTPDENKELATFRETQVGRKYSEIHSRLHNEIVKVSSGFAGQAGELLSSIYGRKAKEYEPWVNEVGRPGARIGAPKPPSGRTPAPPSKRPSARP